MRTRAELEVNLGLLKENLKLIQIECPHSKMLLMVKANAYGHGAAEIAQFAYKEAGISHFGLATTEEAFELSRALKQDDIFYYVFSETLLDDLDLWKMRYSSGNIVPVIYDMESLTKVLNDAEMRKLPIVLKFDIGMNRFGFKASEVSTVANLLIENGKEIEHLMSHFPSASDPRKLDDTKKQYESFRGIKKGFLSLGIKIRNCSVSNSSAIERGIGTDLSFVRPGLLAYGIPTTYENILSWNGKNITRLVAKPLKVMPVKKGEAIGYGSVKSPRDGLLVVLPMGYADGLAAGFNGKKVNCGNSLGEFVGHINMDISFALFPSNASESLSSRDIIIWDHDYSKIMHLAKSMRVLAYHLLCQISSRVPRAYKIGYN